MKQTTLMLVGLVVCAGALGVIEAYEKVGYVPLLGTKLIVSAFLIGVIMWVSERWL